MNLLTALETESLDTIQELIEDQGIPHDSQWQDYAALNYCLESGKKDLALYLLQKKCRVNKTGNSMANLNTPLHKAVKLKDEELVAALLDEHASLAIMDAEGNSPLHLAFINQDNKIVDMLLTSMERTSNFANIKNNIGLTHLHVACTTNKSRAIEGLLATKTHIEDSVNKNSSLWPCYTAMDFAIKYTSVPAVKILSRKTKQQQGTPAVQIVHQRICNLMKAYSALTSQNDQFQSRKPTLVHKAFYTEKYTTGSSSNRQEYDRWMKFEPTNRTDADGLSYMHIASSKGLNEIIEDYLDNGADIDARVSFEKRKFYNFTPLHFAVLYEQLPMAKYLIERGAEVNSSDHHIQGTPLHIALKSKNEALIELLLKNGADVKSVRPADGGTTLHALVDNPYDKSYRFIQKESAISDLSNYVGRLVDMGVDVNAKDRKGNTPLHVVCCEKSLTESIVAERLLECGADIGVKNNEGNTAMDLMRCDERLLLKFRVLYCHVQNLKALGQFLSPEIDECCQKFKEEATKMELLPFVNDTFTNECQDRFDEVARLKKLMLDDVNSLYDFLQVEAQCASEYLTNAALKSLVESNGLNEDYPMYAYIIRLQYRRICDYCGVPISREQTTLDSSERPEANLNDGGENLLDDSMEHISKRIKIE